MGEAAESTNQRLGASLPVPIVQALADKSEVPDKYLRPEIDDEPIVSDVDVELPIVDLARLLDPQLYQEEAAKLEHACGDWGFFQLVNHGVSAELIDQMKRDIMEFFKLPLEEKKAYAQQPGSNEGYGQAFVASEDQKLDWGDMILLITHPASTRNMRFWPTTPPTFREKVDKYSLEINKVTRSLYGLMAKSLGINQEIMFDLFRDEPQRLKFNYYPPCPKADKVIGLSPHTDACGITILLQVNEVDGLQIKKDGKWFPVAPQPGAFIVNVGDIIEILSNGRFRSIEHRAMINPEKERLSIAAFHSPGSNITVAPLPEVVKGGEVKYKSSGYVEYMKAYYASRLDGRCLLESMKLEKGAFTSVG